MKLLRQIGWEVLVLGIVGLVLSVGANNLRAKGTLTLGKNYFYIAEAKPGPPSAATPPVAGASADNAAPPPVQPTSSTENDRPAHDFQEIDLAGVTALLNDPDTETGLNIFVDARNDQSFAEGHIPGAVQCDHYNIDQYWDAVEPLVMGAMKVVVYCGGGDCIDSILMCQDLRDNGVPSEAIFLYEGGWKEWSSSGGAVETGRRE